MPPASLESLVSHAGDASRPFVTYYDIATGERTELSVRTLDNWVAKTANFLTDDGDSPTRVRIDVPTHWLRAVWLLACWTTGACVADHDADIAFVGPDRTADEPLVVASALRPFGLPFTTPPPGMLDFGVEGPAQPDVFVALDPPEPHTPALDLGGRVRTQRDLLAVEPESRRVLVGPGDLERDAELLVATALGQGSIVWVSTLADTDRIAAQENAVPR